MALTEYRKTLSRQDPPMLSNSKTKLKGTGLNKDTRLALAVILALSWQFFHVTKESTELTIRVPLVGGGAVGDDSVLLRSGTLGNTTTQVNQSIGKEKKVFQNITDFTTQIAYPSARSIANTHSERSFAILSGDRHKLETSQSTIVTAYFEVPSKHTSEEYDNWMLNILSLQDAMVIFVEPKLVPKVTKLRSHAQHQTVIVPTALLELPIGTLYPEAFWDDQLMRNPERGRHKSYYVTWIWLSKSWFVAEAIHHNPFQSNFFVWSDIGCFRDNRYKNKKLTQFADLVPKDRVVQMAHHEPILPDEPYQWKKGAHFFHSGSQFAGYKDTVLRYHDMFLDTIDVFVARHMLLVDDQMVAQSTCLSHPNLCAYVRHTQVQDKKYFGLRFLLYYGGSYDLFYPDYGRSINK